VAGGFSRTRAMRLMGLPFFHSRHILGFIDDMTLRQGVQKALNRGEIYYRSRKSVAYVNNGKFGIKTEAEKQRWNECSRLIANAMRASLCAEILSITTTSERARGVRRADRFRPEALYADHARRRHPARRLSMRRAPVSAAPSAPASGGRRAA
jgi:hypothetical protein